MKTLSVATLTLALASFSATLSAQWPAFKTPTIPRTADGKPNLDAPVPKMADGKPDLSGIWENLRRNAPAQGRGQAPGQGNAQAAERAPGQAAGQAATQAAGQASGGAPLATFRDVGTGMKDGLPLQPWAADLKKQRMAENGKYNPDALCLPMGFMQFHMHPQPRKIIQTPGLVLIMYEANGGLRQIFTDGRPLPKDPQPWWYGYSVGHWDGDTLVVETIGLRDGGWLDINGSPQTDAAKITERFHRVNFGTLDVDITVDDPKAYTKPFTVKVAQRLTPDTELIEFICQENDDSRPHMVGK